jgi:hypothetical protein
LAGNRYSFLLPLTIRVTRLGDFFFGRFFRWAIFSLGDFCFGQCFENKLQKLRKFLGYFFHGTGRVLMLTKN